jgi:hypothetical protein
MSTINDANMHSSTQLHKTVSQSSKTWTSPFRVNSNTGPKRKVKNEANYSSYITAGSIPVTESPKKDGVPNEETATAKTGSTDETEVPVEEEKEETEEEPLEPTPPPEVEEPLDESEEPIDLAPAEDAEEIEVVAEAEPEVKPELNESAVENVAVEEKEISKKEIKPALLPIPVVIKSRPKMLRRYKENFNITSSIMNKNKIENLDRKVDLGAGLVLTEEQIYELAKKKLEPLMKQIDDRVAENNARDAEKAFQIEENIRIKDEGLIAADLAQYKSIVDSKTAAATSENDALIKEFDDKAANSKEEFEMYIQSEKEGIIRDQEEAENDEEDAANAHIKNKEELLANSEQFKIDKTKELEDTKSKQIEEAELSEKFAKDSTDLKSKQIDLQSELDAKKLELEEKIKKVEALIAAKHEKKEAIRTSTKRKNVAERSFGIINSKYTQAAANVGILASQVGLLTDRVNAHSTKINHLNTTGKEALQQKRVDATRALDDWNEHLAQVRIEEAKKQEQIKIAAEEERKRLEQEKIAEEERLTKEKEEEELRLTKKKEEEESKLAEQKEKARLLAEKKKKEEEEEAVRIAEEIERLKRIKQLNEEKLELQKSVDAQKSKSNAAGILTGVAGAAVGAVGGAAITSAAMAGNVASNTASGATDAIGNLAKASTPVQKSAEIPSYHEELANSNVGAAKHSNNPFYTAEFNDKNEDLPSTIHEEEEITNDHAKTLNAETSNNDVADLKADDNDTITDKKLEATTGVVGSASDAHAENSTAPVITKRRSMVDEAIANMTSEQIAKMNVPLTPNLQKSSSKTSLKEEAKSAPRSRSNSLTSKLTLKKSKSRSNSLKGSNPTKVATASNRTTINDSPSKLVISAPVVIGAAVGTASAAAVNKAIVSTITDAGNTDVAPVQTTSASVVSAIPSELSEAAEISEAYTVEFKKKEGSPEKVNSPLKNQTAEEGDNDADITDDSDLSPVNTNPVFTEKIDPQGANVESETTPTSANDDFIEVSTLETVSSTEYFAHKDDPSYMVIHQALV